MEHSHSTNDMEKAGYAEGFITQLYKMADEDGLDAGKSWFAYRGGIADKVDKKYVDPYKVIRNEMIVSEKSVKAKRLQIQSLIAQATAVKDAAKRSLIGGLNFLEEHQADAEKLLEQLQKDFEIVDNGTSQVTDKLARMKDLRLRALPARQPHPCRGHLQGSGLPNEPRQEHLHRHDQKL